MFGVHETYLIIYAYGPYYEIDINVVIQATECEGIVEPVMSCPFNLQHPQTGDFQNVEVTGKNYLYRCVQLPTLTRYKIQATLFQKRSP